MKCDICGFNEEDCMCETTNEADDAMPSDYEACGDCGFDHGYEYEEAAKWHKENPGSYRGLGIEENDEFGDFEVCDPLEDTCGEPLKFDDLRHSSDPASDMTRFDAGSDELPDDFEWAIDEPTENELEDVAMGDLEVKDNLERRGMMGESDESDELDESFSRHMDAIVLRESRQVEKQPDSPYRRFAISRKDPLGRIVMR